MSRAFGNLWLRWTLGLFVLVMWWTVILFWYAFFALLLVPYRIVRRGARKRRLEDARHREMLLATMQSAAQIQIHNVNQQLLPAPPVQQLLAAPPVQQSLLAPPSEQAIPRSS